MLCPKCNIETVAEMIEQQTVSICHNPQCACYRQIVSAAPLAPVQQ